MDKSNNNLMGPGALKRGLHTLNVIRTSGSDGLTVSEISAATGIHRPTVYRLIDVLLQERYVRALTGSKRFVLSSPDEKVLDSWASFIEQLKPCLRKIASDTGNSVFLVRRDGIDALCLHRELGSYPIQIVSHNVGDRLPLGVGAAGVALLAALPDQDISAVLEKNEINLANYGNLNKRTVRLLVQNTRSRGYSVVGNYALRGVLGVGMAVYDRSDQPIAAIGVTAIVDRMSEALQRKTAKTIQRNLGRQGGFHNHNAIF